MSNVTILSTHVNIIKTYIGILIIFLIVEAGYSQIYYNSMEIPEEEASDSLWFDIQRIEIIGNYKTKEYIIERELHFSAGDTVHLKNIFLAQKRVLNLFLFNRVMFDLVGEDEVALLITVVERWYVFPLPIFYFNERNWHKISYGGKLLYYNFLGRNILLNLGMAFGYNPEIKLSYRNPWFGGNLKLMTNLSIFKSKVQSNNRGLEDVEDTRAGFDWLIGRRIGHFFYMYCVTGYMEIRHPEITLSSTGRDKLPRLALYLNYDNRDLLEYPHRGYNILLWAEQVKHKAPIDFYRYGIDFRHYIPVTTYSTVAVRGATNLASGKIPLYDRTFLGYGERVRGEFYTKYEGENLINSGVEFRFPIRKIHYLDFPEFAPPGFEDYYRNLKFGVSAGIFYDCGAVWFQDETLNKSHFHYGYGLGLHFHLPYVELLRIDMAFDKNTKLQFIGDLLVAF